jgi:hypothetical protein
MVIKSPFEKNKINGHTLWIFLAFWLILNLVQAYFTDLFHDEAYYFFYSRHLAWGYYDHPPLIALLIRTGYFIFNNELGVRLLFVMLSVGTILSIYKLSEVKNELLFGTMVFSFMIFQVTGFLAFPDALLLFFTALFFLIYKKYTENYGLKEALLLGLVMAGMFYSKYLGILIVFFTVLSNPRLLLKQSFWIAVLVTTVLFLPHLAWQYRHDFPSFYYHLLERSHDEIFRWSNFGDFILGQMGQVNPFLLIPVIYFLIIFKPGNAYDRALKFSAAGSLLLPFLLMIKGRVEANWTMAGLIPLFLLAYRMIEARPKIYRFIYISGGITFIFILFIRTLLIINFLPEQYSKMIKLDIYGWNAFSENVSKIAGDRPVVFVGSYQNPSQYNFYTGKAAFSFNNALYRNNQYDVESIEKQIQGKEALVIFTPNSVAPEDLKDFGISLSDSIRFPNDKYRYYVLEDNYHSYNYVPVEFHLENHTVKAGTELEIPVKIINPGEEEIYFSNVDSNKVYLACYLLQYGKPLIYKMFEEISSLVLKDEYKTSFRMKVPEKPGVYYLKVSIKSGWMPPGINSRLVKLKVE